MEVRVRTPDWVKEIGGGLTRLQLVLSLNQEKHSYGSFPK